MFQMNFLRRPGLAGKPRVDDRSIKGNAVSHEKIEVFNFTRYEGDTVSNSAV